MCLIHFSIRANPFDRICPFALPNYMEGFHYETKKFQCRRYPISLKDIDTNKDITIEGSLDVKTIDDIVNCLFEAEEDNISPIFKELLRPPIHDSLLKLKE